VQIGNSSLERVNMDALINKKQESDFSICEIFEALASKFSDQPAVIDDGVTVSWGELHSKVVHLANYFISQGFGNCVPREKMTNHESGQDHLAICMQNSLQYLVVFMAACYARLAPINVNYRYSSEEMRYVLDDSAAKVIVFDSNFKVVVEQASQSAKHIPAMLESFGSTITDIRATRPHDICLVDSEKSTKSDFVSKCSPDDLIILYTGGTTGMPKGVMWRQGDLFVQALGGRNLRAGGVEWETIEELIEFIASKRGPRLMAVCPFMHGTGLWTALQTILGGGLLVIPKSTEKFDSRVVLHEIESHSVEVLVVVGDAFLAPLIAEIELTQFKSKSLKRIVSSGTQISARNREKITKLLPLAQIKNVVGSSETGPQAEESDQKEFHLRPGGKIIASDRTRFMQDDEIGIGWLATQGRIPLGYLNDQLKSEATFPTVDGIRLSVPGDRVQSLGNGSFVLLGRDSMMVNSGGEKIFIEEVENVIKSHAKVSDVLVVSRPSERWGREIVAVVSRLDESLTQEDLIQHASKSLARYKLPKEFIFVTENLRIESGKGNYRWAQSLVE
jgi:acyl-CoA synthetase (AMP-forming)/AMP-acid ligase II